MKEAFEWRGKRITPRTYEALRIIYQAVQSDPWMKTVGFRWFARQFWPDSAMHTKSSNGGHGSQRGKAAWLAAGSFIGKGYRAHGLFESRVTEPMGIGLTFDGVAFCREHFES